MKDELSHTQRQARFGVFLCAFIIVVVYFFEFYNADLNKYRLTEVVSGKITYCSSSRTDNVRVKSKKKSFYLYIDTTGERAYLYEQPDVFRDLVLEACKLKTEVEIIYRSYNPLLYDWTGYSVLGLINNKTGKAYFTVDDYLAWKKQNKFYGVIAAAVAGVALVYLLLVWFGLIHNRDRNEIKKSIGFRLENGDGLIVKSSEQNGDSWAFFILFSALSIWFFYLAFTGNQFGWTVFIAVFMLLAAYAYLVEIVNSNYLVIDDGYLITYSSPLPWITKSIVISLDEIDYFVGREEVHSSSHGPLIQRFVSVQLMDEDDELHMFYAKDLAEAEAVAELANEKLGRKK